MRAQSPRRLRYPPLWFLYVRQYVGVLQDKKYLKWEESESMSKKKNVNVSRGACRVSPHYSLADTVGEVLRCGTGSCDLSWKPGH